MGNNDWEELEDEWFVNRRPDGTILYWHPSFRGNKHTHHIHLSAEDAERKFGSYKPLRTWYNENIK